MSREIKFRGMDIKGNWYYGNLSILTGKINHVEAGTYISNSVGLPFAYQIRPETVGQFTGLKDKNGKEIYEGDIVTWGKYGDVDPCGVDLISEQGLPHIVGFKNGYFTNTYLTNGMHEIFPVEILGNIYEHPELLKETK